MPPTIPPHPLRTSSMASSLRSTPSTLAPPLPRTTSTTSSLSQNAPSTAFELPIPFTPCNLNNDIHPFFRRENFPLGEVHYNSLIPAFRVASSLLEHTLPFFWAIVFGDSCDDVVAATETGAGVIFQLPEPPAQLTDLQANFLQQKLRRYAKFVQFSASGREDNAHIKKRMKPKFMRGLFAEKIPGQATHIVLEQKLVRDIEFNAASADRDPILEQFLSFKLARILVRELAGAVRAASLPSADKDAHYVGSSAWTTNAGLEWEARTFGGIADISYEPFGPKPETLIAQSRNGSIDASTETGEWPIQDSADLSFTMCEWPSQAVLDYYAARVQAGHRAPLHYRGPKLGLVHEQWSVPFHAINRYFRQEFWNKEVQILGTSAFVFKRENIT